VTLDSMEARVGLLFDTVKRDRLRPEGGTDGELTGNGVAHRIEVNAVFGCGDGRERRQRIGRRAKRPVPG